VRSPGLIAASLSDDPIRWALIADDLTGAADTAVEFCEAGFATAVCLSPDAVARCEAEVCAVTTDSRELTSEEATAEGERWSRSLKASGRQLVFKKIDSLLRGNVAVETEALVSGWGFDRSVLSPALPRLGRTCVAGVLRTQDGQDVELPRTGLIETPDAETESDLEEIVGVALHGQRAVLLTGSSGLGGPLARALAEMHNRSIVDQWPPISAGTVLCLIGSVHPRTTEQMEYALGRYDVVETVLMQLLLSNGDGAYLVRVALGEVDAAWREQLSDLVGGGRIASLVLSGGSTAQLVLGALGADLIEVGGSCTRGAPWGTIRGGVADGLVVVTKSGAFGASDEMTRIVDLLSGKGAK
jgi:uncharacterized protein YgbK (DUF1537 family)